MILTELDQALIEHMAAIVFQQHRPVSYIDFLPEFEVNGKTYHIEYGTLRNKISMLRRKGEIELDYRTMQAFYTLGGQKFGKHQLTMTTNHTEVSYSSDPIVRLVSNLPLQHKALHDIRLRFSVKGVWSTVSADSRYSMNSFSKDISIPSYNIEDLIIRVTIHKTDNVSIIVGCSYRPIAVDISGIIRLSNALTRVEERLSKLVEGGTATGSCDGPGNVISMSIPMYRTWIVTMWHFGSDASIEYTGERFCTSWKVAQDVLIRAYSKQVLIKTRKGKKTRSVIRLERQEYPRKTFNAAVAEKLGEAGDSLL